MEPRVDEKSLIQALDRTQAGLPMGLGYCEGFTHDYVGHGTTTLFAALGVARQGIAMTLASPFSYQYSRLSDPFASEAVPLFGQVAKVCSGVESVERRHWNDQEEARFQGGNHEAGGARGAPGARRGAGDGGALRGAPEPRAAGRERGESGADAPPGRAASGASVLRQPADGTAPGPRRRGRRAASGAVRGHRLPRTRSGSSPASGRRSSRRSIPCRRR